MVANGLSKLTTQNDRQSVTVSGVNSQTGADFTQTYTAGQNFVINEQHTPVAISFNNTGRIMRPTPITSLLL